MTIADLCREMMNSRPGARGIFLAPDLYARHLAEQAEDIPEQWESLRFFVEDYGVPVLLDQNLAEGTAEYIEWPDGVPEGYDGEA